MDFRLSADLDYFLQLCRYHEFRAKCLDLDLVNMSLGGVSAQQTRRRLYEVARAYQRAFGMIWFLAFVARYIKRFVSLLHFR